jgi:hypothetical protein
MLAEVIGLAQCRDNCREPVYASLIVPFEDHGMEQPWATLISQRLVHRRESHQVGMTTVLLVQGPKSCCLGTPTQEMTGRYRGHRNLGSQAAPPFWGPKRLCKVQIPAKFRESTWIFCNLSRLGRQGCGRRHAENLHHTIR